MKYGERNARRGITLIEVIVVVALSVVFGTITLLGLLGRRGATELALTTRQIVSLLQEAQSYSVNRSSSTIWGVHFENATTTAPFYALFPGSYSSGTVVTHYRLPSRVEYATSSIPQGGNLDITFSQLTGMASVSTSITLFLSGQSGASSTIHVASSGAVTY